MCCFSVRGRHGADSRSEKEMSGEGRPSLCLPEHSNHRAFILSTYKASQTLRFLETPGPSKAHSRGSDYTTYASGCRCWVGQSCPALCDRMECSPPGSSVHGISQARILEWAAISYSRGIFPTQGSNPCLLHWQVDSLPLSHQGSPCFSE